MDFSASVPWVDWPVIICMIDFISMYLIVFSIMFWNNKTKEIEEENDANNQTPNDYCLEVVGLPRNVNFKEKDFVNLFTPHIEQELDNEVVDVNIGRALDSSIFR